jgi:hypothetical protein
MATDRQISYILSLTNGSDIEAINAYGLGLRPARELSDREASELIDHLTGKPHAATIAPVAATKTIKLGKGKRVGMTATLRLTAACSISGTVISDNGKAVRIQWSDGSTSSKDATKLTFTA